MSDKKNKLKALEAMMAEGSRMADPSELDTLDAFRGRGERMLSPRELDILDVQRSNRELTGLSRNKPITASMMPSDELSRRISGASTIEELANRKPSLKKSYLFEKAQMLGKSISDQKTGALLDDTMVLNSELNPPKADLKKSRNYVSPDKLDDMISRVDDGIAKRASKTAAKESGEGIFSKIMGKVGSKGFGKIAGGLIGGPLMLASELADAAPAGESPEAEDISIAEAQARSNYNKSPAHADKIAKDQQVVDEMRARRDGRAADIREGQVGDADLRQMLDEKEAILDTVESNKTQEEREEIAQRSLDKKRRSLNLGPNQAIRPRQGEKL